MKRTSLAWTVFAALAPLAASAQTLTDPGFETPGQTLISTGDTQSGKAQIAGVIADGWQDNTSWADVQLTYALDPDRPHGGKAAQRIEVGRGFAQFIQPVHFAAKRYQATVWLRAEPAQWASVTFRQAGPPYAGYGTQAVKIGEHWTPVRLEADMPAGDGYLMVNTGGAGGGPATGTLWIDDASLQPVSPKAVTLQPPSRTIPRTFFGMNVNHMHDAPGFDWPALDFGAYRTWDSGVVWPGVEPQRGVYDWKNLDKDVAQAQAHHADVLFTLGGTPKWATTAPDSLNWYAGYTVPPDNIQDWTEFLTAVATRYKGRIQAYEVWNEPDLKFYAGTPAQLVALERAAADAIHRADPSAWVVAPPPSTVSGIGSLRFYDDYLTAGGGRAVDVFAYHNYGANEEGDIQDVRTFRALLAAHGLPNKPLWKTESGLDRPGQTQPSASAFIARTYLIDAALGVDRVYFYAYDNGPAYVSLDETDPEGKSRDPKRLGATGLAYRQTMRWLTGSRVLSCAGSADGVWVCALRRPDGSRTWAVWSAGGPRTFAIPSDWKARWTQDLAGRTANLAAQTLPLDSAPVLVGR